MKSVLFIFSLACTFYFISGCHSGVDTNDEKSGKSLREPGEETMVFHRQSEPNENAFSFLLPEGWSVTGGITRVDPNVAGGAGNSIEAKLYMKLSSPDHKAGMAWLPDTRYIDLHRHQDTNLADGMNTEGGNFNGMQVMPKQAPLDFIRLVALPFAHPHARQAEIIEVQALPGLAEQLMKMSDSLMPGNALSYEAAIATIAYTENDARYLEKMVCVIEDDGVEGSGTWGNKETWYVRAEKDDFNTYVPLFSTIRKSIVINTKADWSNACINSMLYDEINLDFTGREN